MKRDSGYAAPVEVAGNRSHFDTAAVKGAKQGSNVPTARGPGSLPGTDSAFGEELDCMHLSHHLPPRVYRFADGPRRPGNRCHPPERHVARSHRSV
jgi:hypothetical protein